LENYNVNTGKLPESVQHGEYKALFMMTLTSGECVYGQETEWKIADKE
jgi:hypothetical protein